MSGRNLALIFIVLVSAVCLSGCLNQGTPPNNVDIKDNSFNPPTITVNAGTTVTWNNHDSTDETVTADDGSFDSGNISTGYEYRRTFLQPGIYTYHSKAHPSMRGEVIVSSTGAYPNATLPNTTGTGQAAANATGGAAGVTTISLTAKNIAFDKKSITVPAGAKVTINFDNQDSGVPHNFAVYQSSAATSEIFKGQVITGPGKITYTFTAPSKPGTYFFRCDIHPTKMTGQLIVTPSAGPKTQATGGNASASNQTSALPLSTNKTMPPMFAANRTIGAPTASNQTKPTASAVNQTVTAINKTIESRQSAGPARANASQANVTSENASKSVSSTSSITVALTAKNIAFDKKTITVPAGAKVTINFDNQDSGIPHNFAAYQSPAATNVIFKGQIITGPKKITYTFTAPSKPGTYYFQCDVHPTQMSGQLIVVSSEGSKAQAPAAKPNTTSTPQMNASKTAMPLANTSKIVIPNTSPLKPNASSSNATKAELAMKNNIDIKNMAYNPSFLTVPAGTIVTWTNSDSLAHTVTSTAGKFDSGNIRPGGKFSHTFRDPGTYSYYCKIYPSMSGRIIAI